MQLMLQEDHIMATPASQKMERQATLEREHTEEHRAALRRAVTLEVPDAYSPSLYGTFDDGSVGAAEASSASSSSAARQRLSWDELIERVFENDESGKMVIRKTTSGVM